MASQTIAPRQLEAGDRITVDFTNAQANAANPGRSRWAWTVTGTHMAERDGRMVLVAGLIYHKGDTHIRLVFDFAGDAGGVWRLERPREGGDVWFRWNTPGSVAVRRGDLTGD